MPEFTANPLPGYGSHAPIFERLIRKLLPRTVIEVGTFHGASLIHMHDLAHSYGLNTHFIAVDHWVDPLSKLQVERNLGLRMASGRITLERGDSAEIGCKLKYRDVEADLIYIDAGHDIQTVISDLTLYWHVLAPGGIMFGHDWKMAAVKEAVKFFSIATGKACHVDGEHWELQAK